ncbi:flagellar hook protein FlgE [Telmatospirillum sp. J64-1]|uniref:flagellar hook protein FlgE n=1 Tax=Telmatospirillum sp. J64-1 TaxID=2502183 RepID=UPI00163D5403|nr:flagellar hook-basal body complex protein [Telmatospirillum sp. J64-1]
MSLFASMTAAVSGLNAQARKMGHISENIANVSTTSYKKISTNFSTLVTQSGKRIHSPAGVTSAPYYNNSVQGQIVGSASSTHLALNGGGYFIVRNFPDDTNTAGLNKQNFYTRKGDFGFDDKGNLVNSSGYYLMGRAYDPVTGQLKPGDLTTVNVSNMGGMAKATQNVKIGANLPAAIGITSAWELGGATGDLTVSLGSTSVTLTNVDPTNLQNVVAAINGDLDLQQAGISASASGGRLLLTGPSGAAAPTVTAGAGMTAVAEDLPLGSSPYFTEQTYFDSLGQAHTVRTEYIKSGENQWNVRMLENNAGGEWVDLTDGDPLVITFNANGTLRGITGGPDWMSINGTSGAISFDPSELPAGLNTSPAWSWDDEPLQISLGSFNEASGLTQFSGEFAVTDLVQDGLPYGQFTGVAVDEYGDVWAQYGNGAAVRIYNLPIAVFANPDGLENVAGNAFRATAFSGDASILQPGVGRAGVVISESLESSNVDIAEEFTQMIQTQRAYSANSRVITTADEMTEEVIRIKR